MERLTNPDSGVIKFNDANLMVTIIDKLKIYEDAEEQGLLIRLPCKAGDKVYWTSNFNHGINSGTVHSIRISKFGIDLEISNGNKLFWREYEKVFLTREAAEEALKGGDGE